MSVFLSVIIPSYNEQKNLRRGVLDEVLSYLKKQSFSWEIILSDDGSTDGSLKDLAEFAEKNKNSSALISNFSTCLY